MSDSSVPLLLLPCLAFLLWSVYDKRADVRTKLAAAFLAMIMGTFVALWALF